MRFIGREDGHSSGATQFDCEDSEIATARIGLIATNREPDSLGVPYPSLEGKAIGSITAELIVGGNIALLQALGSVGINEGFDNLKQAVVSGIAALEQAASDTASYRLS